VLKARNSEDKMDLAKAIVYISSAMLLGVLLVYRPFDTSSVVSKILKYRPQTSDTSTAATLITTTLAGTGVSV
jgi:hypothetical protein